MRILKTILISATALILTSCGGMQAIRSLSLGEVQHTHVKRANLSGAHATIGVQMTNNSRKNIIFAAGTIDILIDRSNTARVMLTDTVVVPSGSSIVEMPVRVTLTRGALGHLVMGVLKGNQVTSKDYRIQGSIELKKEGQQPTKLRFNRAVSEQTIEALMSKIKL